MLSQQGRELTNSYLFDITVVESRKESGRSNGRWQSLLAENVLGNYLVVPLIVVLTAIRQYVRQETTHCIPSEPALGSGWLLWE